MQRNNFKNVNYSKVLFSEILKERSITIESFIGIVFVPNYNLEIIKDEEGYKNVEKDYCLIKYSDIYKFFDEEINVNKFKDNEDAKKYFEDFKNALHIHSFDAKELEEYKFKRAINSVPNDLKYTVYVTRFKHKNKNIYKYYVGTTTNIDRREDELNEKKEKFKDFEKDITIWTNQCDDLKKAINLEENLEKWIENEASNKNILKREDIEKIYRKNKKIN